MKKTSRSKDQSWPILRDSESLSMAEVRMLFICIRVLKKRARRVDSSSYTELSVTVATS